MLIKTLFLIFIFHFRAEACNCREIKQERYCYNPACIKYCELEDFFEDINSALLKQCLPNREKKEIFNKNPLSAASAPSFLREVKNKIREKEKKEEKTLQENCPHCSLFPKLQLHFQVESSRHICPEEYIKDHKYQKSLKIEKDNSKCNKAKLMKRLENYVKSLLKQGASDEAEKLWRVCPDPCSFDTSFSIQINEMDCVGSIHVNVLCSHPHRGLFGPIYNASVEYKRALQCKKE